MPQLPDSAVGPIVALGLDQARRALASYEGHVPAAWVQRAVAAVTEAVVPFASMATFLDVTAATGTNALSAIGRAVSNAARRSLLLSALEDADWSLTTAGATLRLGQSGTVLRAIRDLGLHAEYEAAKRAMFGRRRAGAVDAGAPPNEEP